MLTLTRTRARYINSSTGWVYTYPLLTINDEIAAQLALDEERPVSWQSLVQRLPDDPDLLNDAYRLFVETNRVRRPNDPLANCTCSACRSIRRRQVSPQAFLDAVNQLDDVDDAAVLCAKCEEPAWSYDCEDDVNGWSACQGCRDDISTCSQCGDWSIDDYFLSWCGDYSYCESCRDRYLHWCEECDRYYHDDDAEYHRHRGCECQPSSIPLRFEIPANSHGTIKDDERLLVELPTGFITDEALEAALNLMWVEQFRQLWMDAGHPYLFFAESGVVTHGELYEALYSMDRNWQTREGNFTRRLSKMLHTRFNTKLDPGLLSRVGSTIRQHTSNSNRWYVEFTRELNDDAAAFYHEDSCWWGSEGQSRCALKHWGGLGMRCYSTEEQERRMPDGRAWVQPLNENLQPTMDVLGAHAYLVYNGYGDLSGYTAARLVAYLASRTYRKISLSIYHQYVNGSSGFLIADQATCDATDSVYINGLSYHTAVAS